MAINERRREDILSCQLLGAHYHYFSIPDCIYRRSPKTNEALYDSEEDLWVPVHPQEKPLVKQLSQKIRKMLPEKAIIVCPLTLGDHIDHRLTREAVEKAISPAPQNKLWTLFYYADYPYVLNSKPPKEKTDLNSATYLLSPGGIRAWQDAIACHQSQISTFWKDLEEMKTAIQSYYNQKGGIWLGHK
jgi:LmbE family N-acetylglucosaminyl deacetylase